MLSVPEKRADSAELFRDRHLFSSETFTEIRQTRHNIEKPLQNPSLSILPLRRDLLFKYYLSLSASDDPCSFDDHLSFTWHDAFKPNRKATHKSIDLEKSAIVFNIAAICSQIGAMADRASENGRKQACADFQKAAGAFAAAKEMMAAAMAAGKVGEVTVDLTAESLGMLEKAMLAQAQECVFEKAVDAGKSAGACSKVARQASLYYEEALNALNAAPLEQHFDGLWVSYMQIKSAMFYAESCYHYSTELHDNAEIAEEIARLKQGIAALAEARRSVRGFANFLLENVSTLEIDLKENLERAERENGRLYLMRVPPLDSLSPLAAASLVRSIPWSETLEPYKASSSSQSAT